MFRERDAFDQGKVLGDVVRRVRNALGELRDDRVVFREEDAPNS